MRNWTFGQLLATSSRLANALAARGIGKGDRVGVFLSQGAELTLCHLAGYRMGAVVLPLFTLFGEEAVEYRLANAEASAVITDMSQLSKLLALRDRLPHLKTIIVMQAAAMWLGTFIVPDDPSTYGLKGGRPLRSLHLSPNLY